MTQPINGGLAGPCKHSTQSGHSMVRLIKCPLCVECLLRALLALSASFVVPRRTTSEQCYGDEQPAEPDALFDPEVHDPISFDEMGPLLACVSVGVVPHAQKPVFDPICIP